MPADIGDPGSEPVTVGSAALPPPQLVHRPGHESNGWLAGPLDDPDRYELLGTGISGGEGTLWRARYRGGLAAPIPVAVKMLRPPMAASPDWPTAVERRRWHDQAALLRHLEIRHMVRLHEIFAGPAPHLENGAPGGEGSRLVAYAVMEWIEGPTLAELLRGDPATADTLGRRLGYVADVAEALAALHSHTRSCGNPSLHRDVKPTNCIVHADRGVVLVDLSTMRLVDDGFDPAGAHSPGYTAPEVLAAPHLPRTPSCDLYSLGALAAFCLLGDDPALPDEGAALGESLRDAARRAGAADPDALAGHLLAMLDHDPQRRPSDTMQWARALRLAAADNREQAAPPLPRRTRHGSRAARTAVVGVAVAAAVAAGWRLGWWPPFEQGSPAQPLASPRSTPPQAIASSSTAAADAPAALSAARGVIMTPVEGSAVKQCAYLSGTASVPGDATLVLAMRNLTTSNPHLYVEYIFGWDGANSTARWRGAQYFGQGDDTVGQHYEVQLIAVPRAAAKAADDADYLVTEAMARRGELLDTVSLRRVPGAGPNDFCREP